MWELWDEEIVRQDLKLLAESGCEMLRVFPNWELFQPIEISHAGGDIQGEVSELRVVDDQR